MSTPYKIVHELFQKGPSIQFQKRKLSAQYRSRNRYSRQKQKFFDHYIQQQSQSLKKTNQKKNERIFVNMMSNNLSALVSKKNHRSFVIKPNNNNLEKQEQFSNILSNITDFLRSKEIKQKGKKQQQRKVQANFSCMKAKIHHQYHYLPHDNTNQEIFLESFKKIRKDTINDIKNICDPFFSIKTVTFNRAEIHKILKAKMKNESASLVQKQKIFNLSRSDKTRASSIQKRVIISNDSNGDSDNNYTKKMKSYLQLLFKVNFSNQIYVNLSLAKGQETGNSLGTKFKMYIGRGNNNILVKDIMKKRFWWQFTNKVDEDNIHFYWSQNNLEKVHQQQKSSDDIKSYYTFSQILNKNTRVKSKTMKPIQNYNQKILNQEKSLQVQKFIISDGFKIPFQSQYIPDIVSNHLPRNDVIGSKKNLFKSLYYYYKQILNKNPFDVIPQTYHVNSRQSPQFIRFLAENQSQPKKVWIVKPGQNTNRGNSIFLSKFDEVHNLVNKAKHQNGKQFTYIIQSYINRPFLYNNRKFDIRHYMLLTSVNGVFKAYWYKQGYIRTSSEAFDLQNLKDNYIHLTNDAVQKFGQNFSKYQQNNKLSYSQFQRYLQYTYPSKNYNFQKEILNKMKDISLDIVKANYLLIDHKRNKNNFQIFGLDFMIDRDFKPWLIQVNYNPCLQVNGCIVLQRVIPSMLQNTFRIALDPLFPPQAHFPHNKKFYLSDNYLKNLKYELIFDSLALKQEIKNIFVYEDDKFEEQEPGGQQLLIEEV